MLKAKTPKLKGIKKPQISKFKHGFSVDMDGFSDDVNQFAVDLSEYLVKHMHLSFLKFESGKGMFVTTLYRKRGKYARRFTHSGMAGLAAVGIMIAPVIANELPGDNVDPWEAPSPSSVLSASTTDPDTRTVVSDKIRDRVLEYTVQDGDTISSIADKFDITQETILWQNDLTSRSTIKPGDVLEVLPVTGIAHKVVKGDTVHSIAKKYDSSAQAIVDFPYNTFTNDETFELAAGQVIVVPEGIKPQARGSSATPRTRFVTPNAGTVVASGAFAWPTNGSISQGFAWYHKGIDIANRAAPNVVAADSGTVIVAGWPDNYGYGNRVIVDHGNGYQTLYAHLSSIYVRVGQTVNRGDALGKMGSTGRSTGTHLHFEIRKSGTFLNPLGVLR